MAVCKGSRRKIGEIFISSCHLPVAAECDIVIVSEPSPNPIGSSWAVLLTQLIPARGRKLEGLGRIQRASWDTTYPREGTETAPRMLVFPSSSDTTYPREGTETCVHDGHGVRPRTQLIPARGRKRCDLTGFIKGGFGHNLSPRGDGNRRIE